MPTTRKRMTFTVMPDMMPIMDRAKRKFYDRTQSEMIRLLIEAGLHSLNANNEKVRQLNKKTTTHVNL